MLITNNFLKSLGSCDVLKDVLRPVALHVYLSSLVLSETRSKKHRVEISCIPLKPTVLSGPAWILTLYCWKGRFSVIFSREDLRSCSKTLIHLSSSSKSVSEHDV